MRIAIIGTRGIPAMYGGFETLAWELSQRLDARGHEVTVYCRHGRTDEARSVPGRVRRRFLPSIHGKHIETVSHTALSVLDSLVRGYDVVLMVNAANAVLSGFPRLVGAGVALNVDGIERQRMKWGVAGRIWYALGERFALVFPNTIIADAQVIQDYYWERYRRRSALIAYGATILPREPVPTFDDLAGVVAGTYFLYVSRLEPENQALLVIEAYRDVPGDHPLLVVGDAPYATDYKRRLREAAAGDPRVRLLGGIYGEGYADLQRGAMAYIHATSVGGTHPALIESMAAGNLVLTFTTPENLEVTAGTALVFDDRASLTAQCTRIVADPDSDEVRHLRVAALERAQREYSWEAITDRYEVLFQGIVARRRRRGS